MISNLHLLEISTIIMFYMRNYGSEMLCKLPVATHLVEGKAVFQNQFSLIPMLVLLSRMMVGPGMKRKM